MDNTGQVGCVELRIHPRVAFRARLVSLFQETLSGPGALPAAFRAIERLDKAALAGGHAQSKVCADRPAWLSQACPAAGGGALTPSGPEPCWVPLLGAHSLVTNGCAGWCLSGA